jgi:hypothetical protein
MMNFIFNTFLKENSIVQVNIFSYCIYFVLFILVQLKKNATFLNHVLEFECKRNILFID